MDLAVWKGRLYAAWGMIPTGEDVGTPIKLVYATSTDGFHWSAPADLFPRENAWACRFYFYRADGDLVGLCKMGFATLSEDAGKTWSKPVQPPSLIAGSAKIWGQWTADGRFALAYNPDRDRRYPLVLVHGEDGREFRDMCVIHGELSRLRYQGTYKDIGAQYMRGLAEWAPVSVVDDQGKRCLELRDGDPFDHARAVRTFPETAKVRVELDLTPAQTSGRLEIELCDPASRRPVRVALTETGLLQAADGKNAIDLGKYAAGEKLSLIIAADMAAGSYTVQVNGGAAQKLAVAEAATTLQRLSLRTGTWRGLGDGGPVDPAADLPLVDPAVFRLAGSVIQGD